MAKNYFVLNNYRDLDKVYQDVMLWFKGKQYQVEGVLKSGVYIVQAKKTDGIRTILGTNIAFKVKIYPSQDNGKEFIIETSRGKWIQNIAGASLGAIFTGGLTYLTGIAGASWSFVLENELISYLERNSQLTRVQPMENKTQESEVWYSDKPNDSSHYKTSEQKEIIDNLEAEIARLEDAFANDILTEGEFNQKKSILEKQIDDYEVNCIIENKIKQLQEAFAQGILNQEEYSSKLEQMDAQTREQILRERYAERNRIKMIKLKEALNSGILTQAEYDQKIASL
ncbi:SHOCT domain-containing protein [Cyanobacterium stanieri LEGE 03274]|uniref:SHOCT domain-containing protein n=1 Tax=Cyanobacterium stanieri LEGE 03274 TaxID=1828756 RepID=A0ABR9UZR7_9CHRO|nr:SHOCT domain-containing protein [Cyanobacterium stanieri]MBE9221129.1 SHOCT domain-containing protein [Cyanobacterium stanieri LEGE 03274]